jgi:hypothetical protein
MLNEERAHLRPEQGSWGEFLIVADEKRGMQSLGEVNGDRYGDPRHECCCHAAALAISLRSIHSTHGMQLEAAAGGRHRP